MSAPRDLARFEVCGPLPAGVTVLEASAGTGKTFAIAALAARYVAAGTPLANLLLVTFTRMATGELRERVRERLVSGEDGLHRALAGAEPSGDEVLRLLATGPRDDLELRRHRLAQALTDFDGATICTTHSFCEQILSGLGVAGDVEQGIEFVESLSDLVKEVVDDLYLSRFRGAAQPAFDRAEAGRIAGAAIGNPFAPLEPSGAPEDSVPGIRQRFAQSVRAEVQRRKRRGGILTFDDYLARLRSTLAAQAGGPAACERLRSVYRVALVDEFQDTDPVQWEIMRRAFGEGDATLVLIGDPKQAIYSFRGADVYAYLDARRTATTRATLDINWRSDKGLIDAYDALFGGAKLGDVDIAYRPVKAAIGHHGSALIGAPVAAALRLRVVERASMATGLNSGGTIPVGAGRLHVAADLAADVARLLCSGAQIATRAPGGSSPVCERVRPAHIAVLVRRNADAETVRAALRTNGIPAVINGAGSVFATLAAQEWLRLLEALERPASSSRAACAALGPFLGWDARQVASAGTDDWESLQSRLHRWAGVLRNRGVASLAETITRSEGLPGRVLARAGGDRELTDIRHIGQLLHAAATSGQLGTTALTAWLRQRMADAGGEPAGDEASRRLESDAEAVQVRTIHASKGLEFPILYCPYLWDPSWIWKDDPPVFHDPDAADQRTIDIGGQRGPGFAGHWAQAVAEQRGEDLRLAYVALTRARHQAVLWWAGSSDSRNSALGRLLFSRDGEGNVAAEGRAVPADTEVIARLKALAGQAPGCISVETSGDGPGVRWPGEPRLPVALGAARFGRRLDSTWRRTSYSAITSAAHEARVTSEPEQGDVFDEADAGTGHVATIAAGVAAAGEAGDPDAARLRSVPASLAGMPGGVDVGSFVHSVLEAADFAAADLGAELTARVGEEQARYRLDIGDPAAVVAGLRAAIETPFGPPAGPVGELRLRDLARGDRLDEMAFELPLAGGDTPEGEITLMALASLLREHLRSDDALAGYAERLAEPALRGDFRGYLAGSLDLVARTRDAGGTQRFAVVDYKTNWLGAGGEALSTWHYRPAALAREMQAAHYPLQALLYTTALHRYLRWRLRGYEPDANLAGVFYLFLRGMTGAATPRVGGHPCGVFAWRPPTALVEALSDLLDRGMAGP